jgi:hypothetical protein
MIPFRRVAIQPEGIPCLPRELNGWADQAADKGADAFYLRALKRHGTDSHLKDLKLKDGLRWIAPVSISSFFPDLQVVHFGVNDAAESFLGKIRGKSCHGLEDLLEAQKMGFDYAFLSPVFPTQTHPEAVPLGLESLASWCKIVQIPVFALGGITLEMEVACLEAGAHGIAGIRLFE